MLTGARSTCFTWNALGRSVHGVPSRPSGRGFVMSDFRERWQYAAPVSEVASNRIRDAEATFHVEHTQSPLCRPAPCISGETRLQIFGQ